MGKVTLEKKKLSYYKIYEQLFEDPWLPLYHIAQNTLLSRNTVSKYMEEMYQQGILTGPILDIKSASDYKEYVYLLNFEDPLSIFQGLRDFPHVLYHALTFGDWNTFIITDMSLDFSQLVGFQECVMRGTKSSCSLSKLQYMPWEAAFKKIYDTLLHINLEKEPYSPEKTRCLNWNTDEWKLFHAFAPDVRKKVTPLLKTLHVGYETYRNWRNTIKDLCNCLIGFYPEGYSSYTNHSFLLSSPHKSAISSLISLFPVTSEILEINNTSLITIPVPSSDIARNIFCTIYDLKTKHIIHSASHAQIIREYSHNSIRLINNND